tara:strand:- start:65 stop:271 length:207 start_codon:yes stop_codon:yes gene_type:complete
MIIKTIDGREVNSWSEEYRLYCEVKYVFKKFKSNEEKKVFLARIKEKRGIDGYNYLRNEMLKLHDYFK